jgi:hypothetical protein
MKNSIRTLPALLCLLLFSGLTSAEGYTVATAITSVGQYGGGAMYFTTEDDVSACANKKKLFFYTSKATEPDKLYSTLLTALASGMKLKVFLHAPVNCGGENAQEINIPNYYYLYK